MEIEKEHEFALVNEYVKQLAKDILKWRKDLKNYHRFSDFLKHIIVVAKTKDDVISIVFHGAKFDIVSVELIPFYKALKLAKEKIDNITSKKDVLDLFVFLEKNEIDIKLFIPTLMKLGFQQTTLEALYKRAQKIVNFDITKVKVIKVFSYQSNLVNKALELYKYYPTLVNQVKLNDVTCDTIFIANYENEIIGVVRVDITKSRIKGLAVHPDYLGKNVAKVLLTHALKLLDETKSVYVTVWVKEVNVNAKNWWMRRGFKEFSSEHKRFMYLKREVAFINEDDLAKAEKLAKALKDLMNSLMEDIYRHCVSLWNTDNAGLGVLEYISDDIEYAVKKLKEALSMLSDYLQDIEDALKHENKRGFIKHIKYYNEFIRDKYVDKVNIIKARISKKFGIEYTTKNIIRYMVTHDIPISDKSKKLFREVEFLVGELRERL
jgi:ribosomal protein S18 acetylase RimI-like enzyme